MTNGKLFQYNVVNEGGKSEKMKPLEESGGLVDFKENVIFEREKDTAFRSSEYFYDKMEEKYGLTIKQCSELYVRIIKYQVKKYGSNLAGAFLKAHKIKRTDDTFKKKMRRR